MAKKLLRCIPNFSEGRNQAVIDGLAATAKVFKVQTTRPMLATTVASLHSLRGWRKHSSGFSNWVKYASGIDMRPARKWTPSVWGNGRCPFVPVKDITTAECVEIANKEWPNASIVNWYSIFLYDAATRQNGKTWRKCVRTIWRDTEKLILEDWSQTTVVPSSPNCGVTAVGVRMPLAAFNTTLTSNSLEFPIMNF